MNKQAGTEWGQIKAKIEKFRAEHFRAGMMHALKLVDAFPCFYPRDRAKLKRVAALIRREADRRRG